MTESDDSSDRLVSQPGVRISYMELKSFKLYSGKVWSWPLWSVCTLRVAGGNGGVNSGTLCICKSL